MHRVETTISWINRLKSWSPVTNLSLERVKFNMQKLQNAAIQGDEYQRGTLFEKEVMEYLLEKWQRSCMYCGTKDALFEKEHLIPRSRGGSNRISNLGLSCRECNLAKSNLTLEEFLINKQTLLIKIKNQLKAPLKDAAVVNATRNRLLLEMLKFNIPLETGTGAQTKFNRKQFNIPKTHALDAACTSNISGVNNWNIPHIGIKCTGRGSYARTRLDKYGFPRLYFPKEKKVFGFQTGDIIKTIICINSVFKSIIGKIAVRSSGYFNLLYNKKLLSIKWNQCKLVQKADGYQYDVKRYSFLCIENQLITVE
jgi:5-methylcytosine-specific restriction endonuclease McrA